MIIVGYILVILVLRKWEGRDECGAYRKTQDKISARDADYFNLRDH